MRSQNRAEQLRQYGLVGAFLQRWTGRFSARPKPARRMELLETLPLGPKCQLMLVRCGEEQFLVGGGADHVQTIVKLSPDVSVNEQGGLCG